MLQKVAMLPVALMSADEAASIGVGAIRARANAVLSAFMERLKWAFPSY